MGCLWWPISSIELPRKICELDSAFTAPRYRTALIHQAPPLLPSLVTLRFLFSFRSGTVFVSLCFSRQHIAKGKGFSHRYKQRWCFSSPIDSRTHAFPLCDIPLCGERERERASSWVEEHAFQTACIKISSEPPPHAKSMVVSSYTPSPPPMQAGY